MNTLEKVVSTVCAAFAAGALFGDCRYQSRMTVGGYAGTETLSGFPVLVRISPQRIEGFDYADVRADHADIRFCSPDGKTAYPHEVDTWNTAGESLVWVKLPALSGTDTKFLFQYGDANAVADPGAATNVWIGANGGHCAGVWHMSETIDAAAATKAVSADSAKWDASVDMDAVPYYKKGRGDFTEMVSTGGCIGNARVNQTTDFWQHGNGLKTASNCTLDFGGVFTVSMWMRMYPTTNTSMYVMGHLTGSKAAKEGWNLAFNVAKGQYNLELQSSGSGSSNSATLNDYMSDWMHVVAVYDNTDSKIYANGKRINIVGRTINPATDPAVILTFGCCYDSKGYPTWSLTGAFDETRLMSTAVSADWVKAEYDAVAVPNFVTAEPRKAAHSGFILIFM